MILTNILISMSKPHYLILQRF